MSIRELTERRQELGDQIERLRADFEGNDYAWQDDQAETWARVNADYESTVEKINAARAVLQRASEVSEFEDPTIPEVRGEPGRGRNADQRGGGEPTDDDRAAALNCWARNQLGATVSDDELAACRRVGINPSSKQFRFNFAPTQMGNDLAEFYRSRPRHMRQKSVLRREARAIQAGSGGGANAVSESFVADMEVAMLQFGGLREFAEVMVTESGEDLKWPTANDTGNTGSLVSENGSLGSAADPTIASNTYGAYKFSSLPVLVTQEFLEDEFTNFAAMLPGMLGERVARAAAGYYATGTGSSQPTGIVTGATTGKTAASTSAITFDEIIELEHSVDPAYWNDSAYAMHSNVLLAVKLLKDSEGQYLWRRGGTEDTPDTLNMKPYAVLQDMASTIQASADVMIFGDLSKYKIRRVRDVRMYRLDELYRVSNDADGFVAVVREDGKLLNAGTNPVKKLTMAAS